MRASSEWARGVIRKPIPAEHCMTKELETTTLLLPIGSGDLVEAFAKKYYS
jgi:hypothetical protein